LKGISEYITNVHVWDNSGKVLPAGDKHQIEKGS
jgi:hypothetical protein